MRKALDDDFLGRFGQLVTKLAQALLQIGQRLAAKAIDRQEGGFARVQFLQHLTDRGDAGLGQRFGRAVAQLELGDRAIEGGAGRCRALLVSSTNCWRACSFL